MRPADARFRASTINMISIRLSLVGAQVDCNTKTSLPRTFSLISTMTSPSENFDTSTLPSGMPNCLATPAARAGLALPVKTIMLSLIRTMRSPVDYKLRGAKTEKPPHHIVCGGLILMAGEEGLEPSDAGIKIRCLNQLGDSPTQLDVSCLQLSAILASNRHQTKFFYDCTK